MIWDALLGLIDKTVGSLIRLLPNASAPDFGVVDGFSRMLFRLDYYVPVVAPLAFIFSALTAVIGPLVAYRVGLFIYKRVRG